MIEKPEQISISEYDYPLNPDRIAKYPLAERDQSKLLIATQTNISEDKFISLDRHLDSESLLVFNETKVIHARLVFKKESGARVEIFCLEPFAPVQEIQLAFQQKSSVIWKCFVGNSKKWKKGPLFIQFTDDSNTIELKAERVGEQDNTHLIKFSWSPKNLSLSEVLEKIGRIPLPPYLGRDSEEEDQYRYQTIYARNEGSVAAPTAGLHFTEHVFQKLKEKNIEFGHLTLHVGAGTFKPVTSNKIVDHEMHYEKIIITEKLIKQIAQQSGKIVAIGTTSIRSLESLYWFGVKIIVDKTHQFKIYQWDPYQDKYNIQISAEEAIKTVLNYMKANNLFEINGSTQLMIAPGYKFKIVDQIITNFHQPKSTLLLLISAYLGPRWKDIYNYALKNNFRFLSYGDSCLFKV